MTKRPSLCQKQVKQNTFDKKGNNRQIKKRLISEYKYLYNVGPCRQSACFFPVGVVGIFFPFCRQSVNIFFAVCRQSPFNGFEVCKIFLQIQILCMGTCFGVYVFQTSEHVNSCPNPLLETAGYKLHFRFHISAYSALYLLK